MERKDVETLLNALRNGDVLTCFDEMLSKRSGEYKHFFGYSQCEVLSEQQVRCELQRKILG